MRDSGRWVQSVVGGHTQHGEASPVDPAWGKPYGGSMITDAGTRVFMYRRGQKVRFFDGAGKQVGPEQGNVAPAVVYAMYNGWRDEHGKPMSIAQHPIAKG